jgi:hypothetical protein
MGTTKSLGKVYLQDRLTNSEGAKEANDKIERPETKFLRKWGTYR